MTARARLAAMTRERDPHDWYVDPPAATEALLAVERFPGTVWDPACGQGTIPAVFAAAGRNCYATDLVDRSGGAAWFDGVHDFLGEAEPARHLAVCGVDAIVTNPPFGQGRLEGFVERACAIARHKVAVLARLAVLEGCGRHDRIFARLPLARVWVFTWRLSMPPGGRGIEARDGAVQYCWLVFEHGHRGPWAGGWLLRDPQSPPNRDVSADGKACSDGPPQGHRPVKVADQPTGPAPDQSEPAGHGGQRTGGAAEASAEVSPPTRTDGGGGGDTPASDSPDPNKGGGDEDRNLTRPDAGTVLAPSVCPGPLSGAAAGMSPASGGDEINETSAAPQAAIGDIDMPPIPACLRRAPGDRAEVAA